MVERQDSQRGKQGQEHEGLPCHTVMLGLSSRDIQESLKGFKWKVMRSDIYSGNIAMNFKNTTEIQLSIGGLCMQYQHLHFSMF